MGSKLFKSLQIDIKSMLLILNQCYMNLSTISKIIECLFKLHFNQINISTFTFQNQILFFSFCVFFFHYS